MCNTVDSWPSDIRSRCSAGDFPDANRYREILSAFDISSFPKLDKSTVKTIDDVLSIDVPNLVRQFENPYG